MLVLGRGVSVLLAMVGGWAVGVFGAGRVGGVLAVGLWEDLELGVVLFVMIVVCCVGFSVTVSTGCMVSSAAVWCGHGLSRRRLSARARRKFFICLWSNFMGVLELIQRAAAHVNKPLSCLWVCWGKSAVGRVFQVIFSRPGAAARSVCSFPLYSSWVGSM